MNLDAPHQLFYISRSLAEDEQVLAAIVRSAQQGNARRGVTGLLIHTGGHFAQLLEGSKTALDLLWAAIEQDPRHAQPRLLLQRPVAARQCPDWHMAWLELPGADDLLAQCLSPEAELPAQRAERLLARLLAAAGPTAKP